MKPVALVATVVHWPDDTRIRERLIRTLGTAFQVNYAAKDPGPTDRSDLVWIRLSGGRVLRHLRLLRKAVGTTWDVMVVHDPELIPVAIVARWWRRRPVVFDVHEDYVAAAATRSWVPSPLRGLLASATRAMLVLAERFLTITLAEPGYRRFFRRSHPTFPNYPDTTRYPDAVAGTGGAVYLGDVTEERGAHVAVMACSKIGLALEFIGPVSDQLSTRLLDSKGESMVMLSGRLPNPEALERARSARVGLSPLLGAPNHMFSEPTKILEYLALGIPVVASDLPGTRDLVATLDGVELVRPGDAEEMAAAITRALDPSVREKTLAQVGRVRQEFAWPGDEVLEFYLSLV